MDGGQVGNRWAANGGSSWCQQGHDRVLSRVNYAIDTGMRNGGWPMVTKGSQGRTGGAKAMGRGRRDKRWFAWLCITWAQPPKTVNSPHSPRFLPSKALQLHLHSR